MTDVCEWLTALYGGASTYDISKETGIPQPTVSKQLRTGRVTPETVVKIARAYGGTPVEGLVILGLIDAGEAEALGRAVALGEAPDDELVAEVLRRIQKEPGGHPALTDPVDSDSVRFSKATGESIGLREGTPVRPGGAAPS